MNKSLEKIRRYTKENNDLKQCHHFLFNAIYKRKERINQNRLNDRADVIVVSINPAETKKDWEHHNKETPAENSNEKDFHTQIIHENISASAKRWESKTKIFCEDIFGENINETAFFFWSSENIGKKFTETFGYNWKSKQCLKHFNFCKERNIELIQYHKPKIVIAPGIGDANYFSNIYEMDHVKTIKDDTNEHRLIEHFETQHIPFIFTKHWTSAFGFSKRQQEIITDYLSKFA
tara:strand:- start:68 stop:772 length:705 start_codon:yes stop_codon:yes gene_type:complete